MKQFTYWRNGATRSFDFVNRLINCPCLVVYGESITEADKQFKSITGMSPSALPHVGCRFVEVAHVGLTLNHAGAGQRQRA